MRKISLTHSVLCHYLIQLVNYDWGCAMEVISNYAALWINFIEAFTALVLITPNNDALSLESGLLPCARGLWLINSYWAIWSQRLTCLRPMPATPSLPPSSSSQTDMVSVWPPSPQLLFCLLLLRINNCNQHASQTLRSEKIALNKTWTQAHAHTHTWARKGIFLNLWPTFISPTL